MSGVYWIAAVLNGLTLALIVAMPERTKQASQKDTWGHGVGKVLAYSLQVATIALLVLAARAAA